MNWEDYMIIRLIIPVVAILIGIIFKEDTSIGFGVGYLLCWVFSFFSVRIHRPKEVKK